MASPYHRKKKFFRTNEGPNHAIHDFPTASMSLKLAGFMVIHPRAGLGVARRSIIVLVLTPLHSGVQFGEKWIPEGLQ